MRTIIMICGLFLIAHLTTAQQGNPQFYSHHDIVKPSMNASYVRFIKKMKETYQQHNIVMTWNTLALDDNSYVFFSPMKDFDIAAVHRGFADAGRKIGNELMLNFGVRKELTLNRTTNSLQSFCPNTVISHPVKMRTSDT